MSVVAIGAVVAIQSDGTIEVADVATDPATVAGIATQNGTSGTDVDVQNHGILDAYSGLTVGAIHWMDSSGQPTDTKPTSGLLLQMGVAVSGSALSIHLAVDDASNDLTAQSAGATIVAYAPAVDGTYRVGGYLTVTSVTTAVLNYRITWTDQNGVSRTLNLYPAATASASISTTGFWAFAPVCIRAQSGSAITVAVVIASGSGIGYDAGAVITAR